MTRKEFREFVRTKCDEILDLLDRKGGEYADTEDAFFNFNEGCKISTGKYPEEFAWNLRSKHMQSIKDMVTHRVEFPPETVDEKCGDDVLYGLIIWAILNKDNDREKKEGA